MLMAQGIPPTIQFDAGFTAKDRVDFDNFTLEIESFKIVGKAHQVGFWRQFVLRVPQ